MLFPFYERNHRRPVFVIYEFILVPNNYNDTMFYSWIFEPCIQTEIITWPVTAAWPVNIVGQIIEQYSGLVLNFRHHHL